MIPLRLELRNFLSYGESHPPLSLEGIRVACFSGPNGHGKSALLDAMVWALWGEPRGGARAGDDLIRKGAREMEASLEFEMDAARYRVTRKRTLRNRMGTTDLHFEGFDGESWRSLAEGTVSQTQQAIDKLLRMSHRTFVHASFIQQGKADAFMSMSPQQRKGVLGEILGLERYDELAEAAREASGRARNEASRLSSLIQGIEAELAKREAYAQQLGDAERAEHDASTVVEGLTAERTALLIEVERLASVERRAAETADQLADAQERVRSVEGQIRELEQNIAGAQATVARAPAIEQEFQEYQRVDTEERELAARFESWRLAQDDLREAEAAIDRERIRLEADLQGARRQVGETQHRLAGLAEAETQAQGLRSEIADLDELAVQQLDAQRGLDEANKELAVLRQEGERLKGEPEHAQQRIDLLGQHEHCPLCGQILGTDGLAAAQRRLREELEAAEQSLDQVRSAYTGRVAALRAAQDRVGAIQAQLARRAGLERALGDAEARLRRAEQDRETFEGARRAADDLQRALSSNDYAHEVRARVGQLQARLDAVGYDPERHRVTREERDRLSAAPEQMRGLERARATLKTAEAHRSDLEARQREARGRATELAAEAAALAQQAAQLPGARAALQEKEAELQAAAAAQRLASQQLGEARQMVAWLDQREEERTSLATQREAALADVSGYSQLAEAFGKNGIQEMIVDYALPEIQDRANELLARLTDGRMRVTLDTQRAGRGGGTISTLDVNVSDELGIRPYELFSGGEKFRIDFAIRIALSRLLASRANAPLQMLAIDEGFGSQDREGCDRLVEAIRAVQDDFQRILVITHLEDLKDSFPVRIEVTKNHLGSTFTVT